MPDTSFILYYVVSICALLAVLLFIGSVGWWLMGTFYRAIKWLLSLIADQLRHYRDQVKFLIGAYTWLSAVAITSISIMLIQAAITPLPSPHDFFLHLNSALSWPIAPAMPYVKGPIHETTSAQASEKSPALPGLTSEDNTGLSHHQNSDVIEGQATRDDAKPVPAPVSVPEPIVEDVTHDLPFPHDISDVPNLPEGLEEFAVQNALPEADPPHRLVNDQSPPREELEEFIEQALQELENDQSFFEADFAEDNGDANADLISEIDNAATDETADENSVFFPTFSKPRPRALPVYRDLAEEARQTEAAAAAEAAAHAKDDEQAAANHREAETRDRTAELRSLDFVQRCVEGEWNYPIFIRYPREWQVSFTLSLDENGDIAKVERSPVMAEDNATDDELSTFVLSAESALYACEPFLNPSGAIHEAFKIEVVMQPR